jgi:hypothetical protein
MSNVISLMPYMVKAPKALNDYGELLFCPECDSYDFWAVCSKKHIDGAIHVTAMACLSDKCDGKTVVEISDGVVK